MRLAVRRGEAAVGVERAAAPLNLIAFGAQVLDAPVERHDAADLGADVRGAVEMNPGGAVRIEDGESRSIIALADTLIFETTFYPVTLSARGGARAQQRPLAERLADLCAREPMFERAAAMLAASGDDWRELFRVMEIIEKAHGGCPKKRRRASRAAFFRKLEIEEKEWEALHRSARPYRHADAHDDGGPTVRAWQGRLLIQHALNLWLDRAIRV